MLHRSSTVCVGRLDISCREADDRQQSWLLSGQFEVSICRGF